jgi:23S rRNA pseudouridine2605 synthase
VGRLDYATSGLLILTNDVELTKMLLHPSREVTKTYRAEAEGIVSQNELKKLREGVPLDDGMTAPAKARIVRTNKDSTTLEIVLHEGRNRQVRRMLEAIGHPVTHLKRSGFAFLDVKGLDVGKWRELSAKEIVRLKTIHNS